MTTEQMTYYIKKLCFIAHNQCLWKDTNNYRNNIVDIDLTNGRFICKNGKSGLLNKLLFKEGFIIGLLQVNHRYEPYLGNYEIIPITIEDKLAFEEKSRLHWKKTGKWLKEPKLRTYLHEIADLMKVKYNQLPMLNAIDFYVRYFNQFYLIEDMPFEQIMIKHYDNRTKI